MSNTAITIQSVLPSDQKIYEAVEEFHGLLALAAEDLGCPLSYVEERAREVPEISESVEKWRQVLIDSAESALYAAILRGEAWAIKLALTTVGRERGYDLSSGKGGTTVNGPINIVLSPKLVTGQPLIGGDDIIDG